MRYPARLAHLATRAVVAAKLAPTFAEAHHIDHEEAVQRLQHRALGPLLEDLLAATLAGAGLAGRRSSTRRGSSRRWPGRW